ncbi:flagellar basal body rod modification protein [Rhodobacterales bacterium HKCCE3408]|nr:flagellar basal body rod modification protein [Rhodobacterales bacterium HKCCE3408]
MDINQIAATQTARPSDPSAATASEEDPGTIITSDFEAFLRLLTAQLENQDPLNPLESTDFATQLATFSGVEQQVQTNTLLGDLQANLSMMGMGQLAGWIGMDARAAAPVTFTGSPVNIVTDPPVTADRVQLVVSDAAGNEVQRVDIPKTTDPLLWSGTGPDGSPLPHGTYSLSVESFQGSDLIETEDAMVYARIREAFQRGNETWLVLDGGQQVRASEVSGVSAPWVVEN